MNGRCLIVIVTSLLAACGSGNDTVAVSAADPGAVPITGTVSYRERIALSPNAEVEVRLLDVSRMDVPATTLGITRISDPGLPPIDFRLEFNSANIEERNSYVVRAEVREGKRLVFTTDTAHPVLTRGAGYTADLTLVAVDHVPPADAPLLDTHWKLIAIDNQPVANKPAPNDAHLVLASEGQSASGHSGCNRFTGAYEFAEDALTFGPLASTRMACVDTMELERQFLAALASVNRVEVVEQELRLYNGATPALTFVAIH